MAEKKKKKAPKKGWLEKLLGSPAKPSPEQLPNARRVLDPGTLDLLGEKKVKRGK